LSFDEAVKLFLPGLHTGWAWIFPEAFIRFPEAKGRSESHQLEIVEPFQGLLDELNEFFQGPGNDPDGGEGDLLGHRVTGIDDAWHVRSPF